MSLLKSIGANPFLKTLFSQVSGAVVSTAATVADNALQNPTGGTHDYLVAHPVTFFGYVIGVGLFHNLVSAFVSPRANAAPASTGNADPATVSPAK